MKEEGLRELGRGRDGRDGRSKAVGSNWMVEVGDTV